MERKIAEVKGLEGLDEIALRRWEQAYNMLKMRNRAAKQRAAKTTTQPQQLAVAG